MGKYHRFIAPGMDETGHAYQPGGPLPRRRRMQSVSSTSDVVGDPSCPRCNGIGYLRKNVPVGHPDFGEVFPCLCHPARGSHHLQSISRLLPNERALRFTDFVTQGYKGATDALAACQRFAENPDHMLTLWGPVGVGKSVLS